MASCKSNSSISAPTFRTANCWADSTRGDAMNKQLKVQGNRGSGFASRALDWLDARTGVKSLTRKVLDEPIPGGARWAYVFGSGLLFIFLSQTITGICLALYYVPSADSAHTTVA